MPVPSFSFPLNCFTSASNVSTLLWRPSRTVSPADTSLWSFSISSLALRIASASPLCPPPCLPLAVYPICDDRAVDDPPAGLRVPEDDLEVFSPLSPKSISQGCRGLLRVRAVHMGPALSPAVRCRRSSSPCISCSSKSCAAIVDSASWSLEFWADLKHCSMRCAMRVGSTWLFSIRTCSTSLSFSFSLASDLSSAVLSLSTSFFASVSSSLMLRISDT
mmetsp:Transcript_40082/g.94201  ORF Transcript_40082/g.94201 Transcript_40082/m.94201 type:complete len:219 (-) Transcript_40082:421-1077(-)